MIARRQLLELGFVPDAIYHRIRSGRLHPVFRGVYAVGRPQVSQRGWWMAAVLRAGAGARLSHQSAAELWGIRPRTGGWIEVSVPGNSYRRSPGIVVHRRKDLPDADATQRHRIPVTPPALTIVDLAPRLDRDEIEAAINAADRLNLIDPERLRSALEQFPERPGVAIVRHTLDRRTFTTTDSHAERLLLPIARRAGLPQPETGVYVEGSKTDFFFRDLGLVVETDGLTYHRTPAQQASDVVRDQVQAGEGLLPLRFTREQLVFEPEYVEAILRRVALRRRSYS